jgi:thiol-disulfide isomerase/thioredoxin
MQRMDTEDAGARLRRVQGRVSRRQWLALTAGAGTLLGAPLPARAAHEVRAWPAGRPPPPFSLSDLDGQPWSLAALRGRAVLMNFWASWCDPCRAEMPSLQRLAGVRRDSGLVVLAVNYKESVPAIRRFLQTMPVALPILLDRDGEVASAWTPRVFPTTVLIGRDGVPRSVVVGELDWTDDAVAKDLIEPLLARAKAT